MSSSTSFFFWTVPRVRVERAQAVTSPGGPVVLALQRYDPAPARFQGPGRRGFDDCSTGDGYLWTHIRSHGRLG